MPVIDNLVPSKNKRIKGTSQNWFDAEIMEEISDTDKKNSKNSKSRACMKIKITIKKRGMRHKN